MTTSEQYHKNCKTFAEQVAKIEHHIKEQKLYTSFDFGKLHASLAEYAVWAQANAGVIEAALKPAAV
ncbi:MAG: hypothetical protein M3Y27_12800 [Acidobacteriota bacterium]|nr:hypothetical protein [Acidobacteriota bacterium]